MFQIMRLHFDISKIDPLFIWPKTAVTEMNHTEMDQKVHDLMIKKNTLQMQYILHNCILPINACNPLSIFIDLTINIKTVQNLTNA